MRNESAKNCGLIFFLGVGQTFLSVHDNTVSVYQDLAPSPQPSPKGRGSILSPLALWEGSISPAKMVYRERAYLVSPRPLGEGRG